MQMAKDIEARGIAWEVLAEVHDKYAKRAKDLIDKKKEVRAHLALVGLTPDGKVDRLAALPQPMMDQFFQNGESKSRFGIFMRDMLTEGHPVQKYFEETSGFVPAILVQSSEAWVVQQKNPGPEMEALMNGSLAPSESRNREEVVLITIHTREGSIPVMHFIKSWPRRRCVLTPFPDKEAMHSYQGRLSMQSAFADDSTKKPN